MVNLFVQGRARTVSGDTPTDPLVSFVRLGGLFDRETETSWACFWNATRSKAACSRISTRFLHTEQICWGRPSSADMLTPNRSWILEGHLLRLLDAVNRDKYWWLDITKQHKQHVRPEDIARFLAPSTRTHTWNDRANVNIMTLHAACKYTNDASLTVPPKDTCCGQQWLSACARNWYQALLSPPPRAWVRG